MISTIGEAFDKINVLLVDIKEIDSALKKIRGESFLEGIEKDIRITVQTLLTIRQEALRNIENIKSIEIGGDK